MLALLIGAVLISMFGMVMTRTLLFTACLWRTRSEHS